MTRGRPRYDDILTPREWDVLRLLREGLTNEQIAERLGISANTAKYHVAAILAKLEVTSREAAAAWRPDSALARARHSAFVPLATFWKAAAGGKLLIAGAAVGTAGLLVLAIVVLASRHVDDAGPLGKIAYVQAGDMWVRALPDGQPRQLTRDGDNDMPQWSPSGRWLVYRHTVFGPKTFNGPGTPLVPTWESWVISADGNTRRQLDTAGFSFAQWSPVADELLYYAPDRSSRIEAADGSHRRVALSPFASATEAGQIGGIWMPDGKSLLYQEERWRVAAGGTPSSSEDQGPPDDERTLVALGVATIDGSSRKELVGLRDNPAEALVPYGRTADGRFVLFTRWARGAAAAKSQDHVALLAVPVDGGAVRDLGVTLVPGSSAAHPGRSAVMFVLGAERESWTNKWLATIELPAGDVARLTDASEAALAPAWSPDGSQIAYVSAPDGGVDARDAALAARRMWVMSADGSNKRRLIADDGHREENPRWSADGTHVLFAQVSGEPCSTSYALALLNVQDGSVQPVAGGFGPISGMNKRPVVGEVPECPSNDAGAIGEYYGRINFGQSYAWWQAPISR